MKTNSNKPNQITGLRATSSISCATSVPNLSANFVSSTDGTQIGLTITQTQMGQILAYLPQLSAIKSSSADRLKSLDLIVEEMGFNG